MNTKQRPLSKFSAKRLVRIIIMLMAISGGAYYLFDYTFFYIEVHGSINEFFCVVGAFVFSATAYPYYIFSEFLSLGYPWDLLLGILTGSILNGLLIEFVLVKYHAYQMKHSPPKESEEIE